VATAWSNVHGGTVTIREAGDAALLLELEPRIDANVSGRATAIAAAVRRHGLAGVRDVVATFRSVAVHFDPLLADVSAIHGALARSAGQPAVITPGRAIEVPVAYGGDAGPDLLELAAAKRLHPDEVVARHAATSYRVFMLGFLPGFPYLGIVDESIAASRRSTPRVRVPAGSVGIAGRQTGIYPRESPGGWQIIGRTPLRLFDPDRDPPALLAPGDSVRFVPVAASAATFEPALAAAPAAATPPPGRRISVIRPGMLTTIQDEGRWGYQLIGMPVSGALDVEALRVANALVGNERSAAALEVTLLGPELRLEQPTRVAIAGADLSATLDGIRLVPPCVIGARAGSVLRFGERRAGARAYVAFDGGIDAAVTMGSRATHLGTAMGGRPGRPLAAGEWLPLGRANDTPPPVAAGRIGARAAGGVVSGAILRVLPGPQLDFFEDRALDVLQRTRFTVSSQSNRMGYRLHGEANIPRVPDREMISDATFAGAVQVPASGEPILLLADRQTTGGYPQIATVISADLPLAGQLAPGDWVEFRVCTRAEAIAALVAQEGKLLALGG
jgi:KipI family sensor histidine kinase inhibitor